jgi:hypothetical protein
LGHERDVPLEVFMRPIRFVLRMLSVLALAFAVILAVGDAARSVGASALQVTPLMTSWLQTAPASAAAVQDWITATIGPAAWDGVLAPLLGLPGFLVFGLLAFLFYALGRKPAPKRGRIARAA